MGVTCALRASARKKDALHAGGYCYRVGKIDPVPPGEQCSECGSTIDPGAVAAEIVGLDDGGYGARYPSKHPYTGEHLDWEDE